MLVASCALTVIAPVFSSRIACCWSVRMSGANATAKAMRVMVCV